MKKLILSTLILLAPLACRAADELTPLDVRPGLWESTIATQSNGIPGLSEDMLAKLSPEQRAKLEAAMKGAGGPHTYKSCVTAESLKKSMAFGDRPNSSCKRSVVSSSANSARFHIECTNGRMSNVGDGHVEALGSDSVKGETVMKTTMEGGRTTTTNVAFSARWISADCGSIKPGQ